MSLQQILADEMGPWKNLANDFLLGYLYEFRGIKGPYMVVAPKSTLGNWLNEIWCFCPIFSAVKSFRNTPSILRKQRRESSAPKQSGQHDMPFMEGTQIGVVLLVQLVMQGFLLS